MARCDIEELKRRIAELEKTLETHEATAKRARQSLEASEERFRLTFHTSPDSINLNRLSDGLYIDINRGFTKLTGYKREEVIGQTSLSLNIWKNPEDRAQLVELLVQHGVVENFEAEFKRKNGDVTTGLMSARVFMLHGEQVIVSVTRDIGHYKKLERQLHQAQKFEAIGTLAGGIAHDFNNLMMGIRGRVSLMNVALDPSDPMKEHIRAIEEYVLSATNLTGQLLGIARGGKYQVIPTDIGELIGNTAEMFGRTRKQIAIHNRIGCGGLVVEVDRRQLEQVFLNLFLNSSQAMPAGGDLYLETSIVRPDEEFCSAHEIRLGRYCRISVTDTGHGMDSSTCRKVFDPFFTTREKERGTGLGLASAYGIVKNHKGAITVYSEVGHGTTFNIYLPLSEKEVISTNPVEMECVQGEETILLVDDETMITEVGAIMLETLGYNVFVANSGQKAVEMLKEAGQRIHLVILDLIMPGMDGASTFDAMRAVKPDIRVMLSSGYSINGQATDIMDRGCNGFIQKPFNIEELSTKIREILDRS